jgi:hypothetical protein
MLFESAFGIFDRLERVTVASEDIGLCNVYMSLAVLNAKSRTRDF